MPDNNFMRIFKISDSNETKIFPVRDSHVNIAYGECSTSESSVTKDVTIPDDSGWVLRSGSVIIVKFTNNVGDNSFLRVSGTGLTKSIYLNGSAISSGSILSGDIVTFIYDGSYFNVTAIDRAATANADKKIDKAYENNDVEPIAFSGLPPMAGFATWTDGDDTYSCFDGNNYVFDRYTRTWTIKSFSGLSPNNLVEACVWTDGDNVYYSNGTANAQYVLDKSTFTWSIKTWNIGGFILGNDIWTDGDNVYYSENSSRQYVLDKATSTWSTKSWIGWNGLADFSGDGIWTDGENIYYSNGSVQKVLDKSTSRWYDKTWNGLSNILRKYIWTDGDNIYYSNGSVQKVLDRSTSTWSGKVWTGWSGSVTLDARNIWSDGYNTYYSYLTDQYMIMSSSQRRILLGVNGQFVNRTFTSLLGETSATAYRGDRGKAAYDASVINVDDTPTLNSTNLVRSGGVYNAISNKYTKPVTGIPASDIASGVIPGVMTGATSSNGGASGLVPAPAIADQTSFLKGDGTWDVSPIQEFLDIGVNHNNFYRGKNLGTLASSDIDDFCTEHEIAQGNFKDLYLGDYFILQDGTYNVEWMIAAFDYTFNYNKSSTAHITNHAIAIIPRGAGIEKRRFHSSDVTTSGIRSSELGEFLYGSFKSHFAEFLGDHVGEGMISMSNATDADGVATGMATGTSSVVIPCEVEFFGSITATKNPNTDCTGKHLLPVFNFITPYQFSSENYWLCGNANGTQYTCTRIGGAAPFRANATSTDYYVRPMIFIM